MRITGLTPFYNTAAVQQNASRTNLNYEIKDTVNFKAKPTESVKLSNEAKTALKFADELVVLLEESPKDTDAINTLMQKYAPKAELLKLDEDEAKKAKGAGYTEYSYDDNCKLESLKVYVPKPDFEDEKSVAKYAAVLSHEMTHCIQRTNDDGMLGFDKFARYDLQQAKLVSQISQTIMKQLLHPRAEFIFKNPEVKDDLRKYAFDFPHPADVSEKAVLEGNGIKAQIVFENTLNKDFDARYNDIMGSLKEYEPYKYEILPSKDKPEKLKRAVRQGVATYARVEKEAYTVQSEVLKKHCNMQGKCTTDYVPLVHEMIEKTFSK